MKLFVNEEVLWQSKNKQHILTSHRLREIHDGVFGSTIKSIMLEELTSCELRTIREPHFLRKAAIYFFSLNGAVYLLNKYLFNAELIKIFFDDLQIGAGTVKFIFYISIVIALVFVVLFFFSVKKVFSFYATATVINIQLRWLNFEERETFISKIEEAKINRYK